MKSFLTLLLIYANMILAQAQLNLPNASPDQELKQQIGFTDVAVKYSRPSARGRVIFGDLVPFDEIWRTGAHDATTIWFSDSVKVNGVNIPADTFSLFTIPGKNEWTIILNKVAEMHGTSDYSQDNDQLRFTVKSEKSPRFYETFTIEINDFTKEGAYVYLLWENTQAKFSIQSYADQKVMAEIAERINIKKEEKPSLYYQASLYYFNSSKDLHQAYEWIKVANGKTQDAAYLQLQAKIEASQGRIREALATLTRSTELAKAKKLEPILKANEKLVQDWSNKKSKK
ncbi:MAG: DUF2911 domain-containing protein [Bacteroidota bacterium]